MGMVGQGEAKSLSRKPGDPDLAKVWTAGCWDRGTNDGQEASGDAGQSLGPCIGTAAYA